MHRRPRISRKIADRKMTRTDLRKILQSIRAKRLMEQSDDIGSEQDLSNDPTQAEAQLKTNSGTGINVCIFPCNKAAEHVVPECLRSAKHAHTAEVSIAQSSAANNVSVAVCENLLTQVSEKIEALRCEMKLYESQNSQLKVLQQEYKQMLSKLQSEREEFEAYKQEEKRKLEAEIEDGKRKIRVQKKIRERLHRPVAPVKQVPKTNEKHADAETTAQLQRRLKQSNSENGRLKKKLELSEKERDSLKAMVKQLEEQRVQLLEKIEKMSDIKQGSNLDNILTAFKGDHVTAQRIANYSTTTFQLTNSEFRTEGLLPNEHSQCNGFRADTKLNGEHLRLSVESAEGHVHRSRCSTELGTSSRYDGDTSESSVVISATLVTRFNLDEAINRTSPPKCSSSPLLQSVSKQVSKLCQSNAQSVQTLHESCNITSSGSCVDWQSVVRSSAVPYLQQQSVEGLMPRKTQLTSPACHFVSVDSTRSEDGLSEDPVEDNSSVGVISKGTEGLTKSTMSLNSSSRRPVILSRELFAKKGSETAVQKSSSKVDVGFRKSSSSSTANVSIVTKDIVCPTPPTVQNSLLNLHEHSYNCSEATEANLDLRVAPEINVSDKWQANDNGVEDVFADAPPCTEELIRKIKSDCGILEDFAEPDMKISTNSENLEQEHRNSSRLAEDAPEHLSDIERKLQTLMTEHIPSKTQLNGEFEDEQESDETEVGWVKAATSIEKVRALKTDDTTVGALVDGPPSTEELIQKIKLDCGIVEAFARPQSKLSTNPANLGQQSSNSSNSSADPSECLRDILQKFRTSLVQCVPPKNLLNGKHVPGGLQDGQIKVNTLIKKYSHTDTPTSEHEMTEARKSRSMQLQCTSTVANKQQSPVRCASRTWALDSSGQKMFLTVVSKEIDPFTQVIVYKFQNGDQKDLHPDGKVVYRYGKSGTVHTIFPCGDKEIKFSNGQIEMHHKNGDIEVTYPDGTIRHIYASGEEVRRMPDGVVARKMVDGTETVEYPNGQREVRTEFYKSRYYPNGTVKTVYADGKQVTRFTNGRVRIKDKDGTLLVNDTSVE